MYMYTVLSMNLQDCIFSLQIKCLLPSSVPPVIEDSHVIKPVPVVVGNSARLECRAEGIPTPRITWKRNNRELSVYTNPNLRLHDEHMTLEIINAQRVDAGAYSCVASNNAGETSKEFELNVRGTCTNSQQPRSCHRQYAA